MLFQEMTSTPNFGDAIAEKLGQAGVDPSDIIAFFLETDRASESFGGRRSHRLLP